MRSKQCRDRWGSVEAWTKERADFVLKSARGPRYRMKLRRTIEKGKCTDPTPGDVSKSDSRHR